MIDGVIITPLPIIQLADGDVLHGIKSSEGNYFGFGEAYFSMIKHNSIKGWKRHHEMVMNLIVPLGSIRFVLYDDREDSSSFSQFQEVLLSKNNKYSCLTIPPMIWLGFQGLEVNDSMLLNVANVEHNPLEVDKKNLEEIEFNWSD